MTADEPQGADHDLGGRLHMLEARILEEVRIEQHAQDGLHIELRVPERTDQGIDRLLVLRRFDRPSRHLRLVGDEEVVQVPADESTASRLLHDNVDDVFAVETALVPEEHFLAVIVIFGAILELPREPAIGCARNLGLEGPAGEGP